MPAKAKKPCSQPGCGGLTTTRFCEKHQTDNHAKTSARAYDRYRNSTEARKEYRSARWMRFKSLFLPAQGGQCQRLDEFSGVRCGRLATILHHRKHPILPDNTVDYDLFYDADNIVGCCAAHHDGGAQGDRGTERWHPTNAELISTSF